MNPDYLDRFGGIGRLYGRAGLQRLHDAHVCVIGIGGVGSWAAEALARSGIGTITLIDMDDICVTNTNRQIHALNGTVGQLKTDVVAERLRAINPQCDVRPVMAFVTTNNLNELIHSGFDYVIDCIDSVKSKAALIAHCKRRKIRIVTTGAAGGQIDPTQIQIGDLNKTFNDPLARKVRSLLRREYHFSRNPSRNYSVPCVFSAFVISNLRRNNSFSIIMEVSVAARLVALSVRSSISKSSAVARTWEFGCRSSPNASTRAPSSGPP